MKIIDEIPVWGEPEDGALVQIKNCAKDAYAVALMADNHKGYSCPIGGVVAYTDSISPNCVGFDIACFPGSQRVELDNGEFVLSTPNHIFYLRDGKTVAAKDLVAGQSLMPLYIEIYGDIPLPMRSFRNKRFKLADYLSVYNPRDGLYYPIHHL